MIIEKKRMDFSFTSIDSSAAQHYNLKPRMMKDLRIYSVTIFRCAKLFYYLFFPKKKVILFFRCASFGFLSLVNSD